jgi:hypothetical protein
MACVRGMNRKHFDGESERNRVENDKKKSRVLWGRAAEWCNPFPVNPLHDVILELKIKKKKILEHFFLSLRTNHKIYRQKIE